MFHYSGPMLIDLLSHVIYFPISFSIEEGDYATVSGDSDKFMKALGRPLSPRDVLLGERIGEGQFGDVHTGVLYPDVSILLL